MFVKLGYYSFQYLRNKKLIRDLELLFSSAGSDEAIAQTILKECNRVEQL
jgi:hypothetical protein